MKTATKTEIRKELESYVALYQRQHAGSLPNNMAILYDYLTLVGETNWYAAPAAVISTRNVEPIRTSTSGPQTALTGPEVIAVATGATHPSSSLPQQAAAPATCCKIKAVGQEDMPGQNGERT